MRKRFAFLFFVLLVGIAAPAAHAFTIIITEPNTPLVPNSIIELAQRLGYFEQQGVHVDFKRVPGTPLAIAALSAGDGDMANVSLAALLNLTKRGDARFRAVSSPSRSMSYVIAARNSVASMAELSGKPFGIGQAGTLDDTLNRLVLRSENVEPDAIRMVRIGAPELRLKALAAGQIDATTISLGTWAAFPNKAGLQVLLPQDRYFAAAPITAKINIVPADVGPEKRQESVKVIAALVALARDFAAHPQRWADAMHEARPDVSETVLRSLGVSYANDWCVDGCFDPDELTRSAQLLQNGSDHGKIVPLSAWTDFSLLADALRLSLAKSDTDRQRASR